MEEDLVSPRLAIRVGIENGSELAVGLSLLFEEGKELGCWASKMNLSKVFPAVLVIKPVDTASIVWANCSGVIGFCANVSPRKES